MPKPTNSIVNALRVIERVSLDQPIGISDLARALELPKTTVHRMLNTLSASGWARQDTRGGWSLSLRAAAIGRRVLDGPSIAALARPVMEDLSMDTGETVRLWLVEGSTVLLAENVEGSHAVRPVVMEMSAHVPMHATAVGKAVLASWPEPQLDRYLESPIAAMTDETITEPAELRRQLEAVRSLGYASAWNEAHPGVGGVAAIFTLPNDRSAALAVTFPTHRLTDELVARFGSLVLDAVRRIEAPFITSIPSVGSHTDLVAP